MNEKGEGNLIIYQKYLELIYYTNDILQKYPKHEKFALVQEIKSNLYEGLKYLMFAQKEFSNANRLKYLNHLDVTLNLQKVLIRISYKYKYISSNNYSSWSTKLTDVCNLLGAWIKSCLKR
ncbi:MAG: diversity-generating retroelement protein Avd [Clostridia bacterium]|nr:diversity-generating retroelement protein Avd [Clostridia bacterium]